TSIDEGLYSRQLYVMGKSAMLKMGKANVLVSGLSGLGAEIAKNVILAGVRSVTLHDDTPVRLEDLSSSYCAAEGDVGRPRAEAALPRLRGLNPHVEVRLLHGSLTAALQRQGDAEGRAGGRSDGDASSGRPVDPFDVVVLVDAGVGAQVAANDLCRCIGARFVAASLRGAFASLFNDFGAMWTVDDADGEEPKACLVGVVALAEQEAAPTFEVRVVDGERHHFQAGDVVRFEGLCCLEGGGPHSLDGREAEVVRVFSPARFVVPAVTEDTGGGGGGRAIQVKKPTQLEFLPLRHALRLPRPALLALMESTDFAKAGAGRQLTALACFMALDDYRAQNGRPPRAGSASDAAAFVELVRRTPWVAAAAAKGRAAQLTATSEGEGDADPDVAATFARTCEGALAPVTSFWGGLVAQEVLKGCSALFLPAHQWLLYDCIEALPTPLPGPAACAARGDRYDGQRAVLGDAVCSALHRKRVFLVGAGAIGCELLKLFALMGVGCRDPQNAGGEGGVVVVTDMDIIERSNLNRQFLFRASDVGRGKAAAAAAAAAVINPALVTRALDKRVGPETESFFSDSFWKRLDVVANALDNAAARLYVDGRCVFYGKPLLESGTLGTKGNMQV
ncbi:unnamed protein product, partial [Phaeothamnion confervicola]